MGQTALRMKSHNELTEDDLNILEAKSKMPKEEIILWYEHFIRECPSSKMDKSKFTEYYSMFVKKENIEQITDRVFTAFDTDKNGTIDFTEFLAAYVITSNPGEHDQKAHLNYVFDLYDLDNNKVLDQHEIQHVLLIMFKLLGVRERNVDIDQCLENIMKSLDVNNDTKITKKEFIDGILGDCFLYSLLSPFD